MPARKEKKQPRIKNYTEHKVKNEEGKWEVHRKPIYDEAEDLFEPLKHFYSFHEFDGKRHVLGKSDPRLIISTAEQMIARLRALGYSVDFSMHKGAITKAEYRSMVLERAQIIERFSDMTEMQKDPKTHYPSSVPKPESNGTFKFALSLLTVVSEKDRYRMAAALLSGFMPRAFDGEKPLFSVLAEAKSSGKTSAVRRMVRICSNEYPIELDGNGEHDNSAQGGIPNMMRKYALYDNLQYLKKEQMKEITTNVTQSYVRAWAFGASRSRVPNNKTYFATFNTTESIDSDVLNRIVSIRMKDGRDMSPEEKASIITYLNKMYEERHKVQSDIMYIISTCGVDFNNPEKQITELGLTVSLHPKAAHWSRCMAIMLHSVYPEIKAFDFGIDEQDMGLDSVTHELEEFFIGLLDSHGGQCVRMSYKELHERISDESEYGRNSRVGSNTKSMNGHFERHAGSMKRVRVRKTPKPYWNQAGHGTVRGWDIWLAEVEGKVDFENMPQFGTPLTILPNPGSRAEKVDKIMGSGL